MERFKILFLISVFLMNTALFAQVVTEPICIGEKLIFKSKILNQDRDILIQLPENYNNTTSDFPVHYVLDGEIIFNSYSSIAALKAQNEEIPAAIIIGIPNIDRGFDLNPGANGDNFLAFITKELIPYIDKRYRTNENRVLTGYSMAGNFVIYTLLTGQEAFNMFLSGSPFRLDMYTSAQIDSFIHNLKSKRILYTSIGRIDQAKQVEFFKVFCEQFDEKANGFVDFKYEYASNRHHNNNFLINWQDGMDYLYRDWKIEN